MAADDGILGLLGRMNDPAALYGGALNDPATRQAMAGRGLLAMAGSFADSAMPTRMPTPFGAVLGHAAGAAGASEDALMEARLRNAQAQLAMSSVGLQNILGPAYQAQIEEAKRLAAGGAPGGGIPSPPAPGAVVPGLISPGAGPAGPAPTGPINPELVTWEAKNQGLNPLIAHTGADIESSYGTNTGNKVSPSNTGVFQRAKADAPGGMNDTFDNQIKLGVSDLVTARDGLRASLGREPSNAEVYLAHQQGVSGATKLISNPSTPAGDLVRPVNISNNGGDPKAPASAFVAHWEQAYNKREAKFASLAAAGPPGGGIAAGPPPPPPGPGAPGAAPGGLLTMPDVIGQMNAPIPGIAPGAPGPAAPPPAAPGPVAARPPSAGDMLVAANQATQAAGGLPPLRGLPQMADASGQVPIPAGPPPGPPAPNLVRGGAIPGLLGGGAAPPAPPPQVAAGPPPGPQSLIPQPAPQPPVPPIAQPQAPPPAPGGPPAPSPLNLPPPPPMPGGMGAPVQPTPQQMMAQGIVGLSALIGKPAPEFMQKIAGLPVEMQMEQYKAYVGAQANQMTERYKKEIEVASAGTLEYLKTQGALPADLTKMTTEQDLKLRNDMANNGFLQGPDGKYNIINPAWLDKKAREAGIEAQAKAQFDLKEVTVTDPVTGQQRKQQMTAAQAADYYRTQGGGGAGPGTPGAGIPGLPTAPGAAAPGIPGTPIYTPGQEAGSKAVAEKNAADFATVHKEAGDAALAQAQATNMRQEAKNFYTGSGAEYNQALNKVLLTLNPSDPERANKVASYETFIKDAGFLARDQARTLGGRIGVQELTMVRDTLAGPTTTERGLDRVMAQIQGLSDYRLVKQQAMNNYVTRPGAAPGGWDNNGFEAQFNANVSPYTLMYMRLSDQDRGELLSKLGQSKEGRTELQRLQGQHKYLTDNNLLPR